MVKRFGGRYVKEEDEVWTVLLMALMVKGVRKLFNWSHRDELQLIIRSVWNNLFLLWHSSSSYLPERKSRFINGS